MGVFRNFFLILITFLVILLPIFLIHFYKTQPTKATGGAGDIQAFSTTNQGQLPQRLEDHTTVTATIGGTSYIYVLGGYNGSSNQFTVYKTTIDSSGDIGAFDTTNQGQLPQDLYAHTTVTATIGGTSYIYVLGGINSSSFQSTVYKTTIDGSGDIGAFATTNQGQLPQILSYHTTVTATIGGTNYIYVLGGYNGSSSQSTVYKATIDSSGDIGAFDTTNQGQLPQILYSHTTVTSTIGGTSYIYVLGGNDGSYTGHSTVYKATIDSSGDIGAFATTNQGQLPQILSYHTTVTAAIGGTNYIYVLGGNDSSYTGQSTVYKAQIPAHIDVPNPTLTQSCGLDIALVLDNSTSITAPDLTQMKEAMNTFIASLSGTPTMFSVTRFSSIGVVLQDFTSDPASASAAVNSIPVGGGTTNWEDGLIKTQSTFDPRSNPNLVIFASDGNPNTIGNPGTSASEADSVTAAVAIADSLKTDQNARILAIGIGSSPTLSNLEAISGTNVNDSNILNSDVITTNFSTLATQLADYATAACNGTISVNNYINSIDPSNRSGTGWAFDVAGNSGNTTDDNGQTVAVTVDPSSGYSVVQTTAPDGYVFSSASCQLSDGTPVGNPITNGVGDITIGSNDILTCNFVNIAATPTDTPTLTPTPTPTNTPTPTLTPTPTATPTGTLTPTPTSTLTPTPSATPTPTSTLTPTATIGLKPGLVTGNPSILTAGAIGIMLTVIGGILMLML